MYINFTIINKNFKKNYRLTDRFTRKDQPQTSRNQKLLPHAHRINEIHLHDQLNMNILTVLQDVDLSHRRKYIYIYHYYFYQFLKIKKPLNSSF